MYCLPDYVTAAMKSMREIGLIFVTLLIVLAIVGGVFLTEEPEGSVGTEHPSIPEMRIGGEGNSRIEPISGLAFALHCGSLILVCAFIALGIQPRRRRSVFWVFLSAILIVCILVWWLIYQGHQVFLESGEVSMFLGFPIPSAWAIYGVWGSGALLTVFYVVGFRYFIFSREDEKAFDELVARVKREREID